MNLIYVLVNVGCETYISRGLLPPSRWRSTGRSLVATILRWATAHTGAVGCPTRTCLGLKTLHAHRVKVALSNRVGKVTITEGPVF